jgi:ABC-2 type transport system permease protein
LIADRLASDLLDRVVAGADYVRVHVGEDGSISPDDDELNRFVVPTIFAFLLMMSIFMGSGTLLQSVSEEKENRMVDVLLTSVSPLSLMAGKILALGTTSLVQVIVWIASLAIIGPQIIDQIPNAGDLEIEPLTLAYVSLFFIAGYFLFSVILAGIGSATTSAKEAGPLSAIVMGPAIVPVWLSSVILSAPEGGLARLLSFVPVTAPTTMMQHLGGRRVDRRGAGKPGGNGAGRGGDAVRLSPDLPGRTAAVRPAHDPRRRVASSESGGLARYASRTRRCGPEPDRHFGLRRQSKRASVTTPRRRRPGCRLF